jgi:signal transduction histidine kinase
LVPSELAFLRFAAGIRALLVVLSCVAVLASSETHWGVDLLLLFPYLVWTTVLLVRTLHGWPLAASKVWLWIDALALLVTSQLIATMLPMFGVATVLPVVAMAVLAGVVPALALALVCGITIFLLSGTLVDALAATPPKLTLQMLVPVIVVAFGPAAALLTRPSRELRQRLKLIDTLNERSDPRQGLRLQIDVLFEQLAANFNLNAATISLTGPEPRVFQWRRPRETSVLVGTDAAQWRERFAWLPGGHGCVAAIDAAGRIAATVLDPRNGARAKSIVVDDAVRESLALPGTSSYAMVLPLINYGQAHGTLCLTRAEPAFTPADLRWVHDVMRETMPLLERSDLLEQLQRETASRERERIGRDLHDSAVQPYLGLKYGLEALARQAGPDNAIGPQLRQLIVLATEELSTLRDVVSGLRRGDDPNQDMASAPLAALQREAQRFESLYGLKVNVFAPHAPRLRGAAAKAVLHMVNEALTNARRHTSARAVAVLLDVDQSDVMLRLRNDHGPGPSQPSDFLPRSIAERAKELGGRVNVTHEQNFTEVVITLPILGAVG